MYELCGKYFSGSETFFCFFMRSLQCSQMSETNRHQRNYWKLLIKINDLYYEGFKCRHTIYSPTTLKKTVQRLWGRRSVNFFQPVNFTNLRYRLCQYSQWELSSKTLPPYYRRKHWPNRKKQVNSFPSPPPLFQAKSTSYLTELPDHVLQNVGRSIIQKRLEGWQIGAFL